MNNTISTTSVVEPFFRIQKIESDGHFGDCKLIGNRISKIRVKFGKGYRVYYKKKKGLLFYLSKGTSPLSKMILEKLEKSGIN